MSLFFLLLAKIPEFMKKSDRIVGGHFAPSYIPWQAQVFLGIESYWSQGEEGHQCGATILDAKTILSAAHCFYAGEELIKKEKVPKEYHGKKFIDALGATIRVGLIDQEKSEASMQVIFS